MIEDDIFGEGRMLIEITREGNLGGIKLRDRQRQHEQELREKGKQKQEGLGGKVEAYVSDRRREAMESGWRGEKLSSYLVWQEGIYRQYLTRKGKEPPDHEPVIGSKFSDALAQRVKERQHHAISERSGQAQQQRLEREAEWTQQKRRV